MPLHLKNEDVKETRVELAPDQGDGMMVLHQAHGVDASMMIAHRVPGYHTRPHKHDAEQINYIVSGEIWFFVEDRAFRCKAGDFMRIPRNRVHWAWNRSETDEAVVMETHAPPLSPGADREHNFLLDESEPAQPYAAYNEFVDYDYAAVEARMDEIEE